MNAAGQRERDLAALAKGVDLLVIGGGITGAAVARQALRAGLRVALVEARDFAWGTSSRSTKLIHGGLRYLPQLNFKLVREALRERERLRAEAPGLVRPLQMVLVSPAPGITRWQLRAAMVAYHALWGRRAPPEMTHQDLVKGIPGLRVEAGTRGLPYDEAQVDDARLVLRLVREAGRAGGWTLNYVRVKGLVQEQGEVVGASLEDSLDGRQVVVRARAIVNATGAFADRLRADWTRQYHLWSIVCANCGIRDPQCASYQFFSGMEDPDWIRLSSDRLTERFESKLIIGLTKNLPINQPIAQHRNFRVANDRDPDDYGKAEHR